MKDYQNMADLFPKEHNPYGPPAALIDESMANWEKMQYEGGVQRELDYLKFYRKDGIWFCTSVPSIRDESKQILINSKRTADIVGITRQAVYSFHRRAQKTPNSRSKFPRAVRQDPDGGNPWFDWREVAAYAEERNGKPAEEEGDLRGGMFEELFYPNENKQ